jgi:ubiquinone/menaquinone biosynthesis C-methylase UbiE
MSPSFANRSYEPERLDTGEYTDAEYSLWLREMRRVNRLAGDGHALKRALADRPPLLSNGRISILDVGAGSGELLKIAKEALAPAETLLVGAELNPRAAKAIAFRRPEFGVHSVEANAIQLPFVDKAFDIVICSLFLHHLTEEQGMSLLDEMSRMAVQQIIAIDLHRHPLAYHLYHTFSPLFLQRLTVEDGSLSILRSYRPHELQRIAETARLREPTTRRSFPFRLVLTAKPGDT